MRIRLFSDLHLEFSEFDPPAADCDVVVLAGDIHVGPMALPWIRDRFQAPVLYVLGNHEYYHHAVDDLDRSLGLLLADDPEVRLLDNASFRLGDWEFFGCTLWTDFDLDGDARGCQTAAAAAMSDYALIRLRREQRRLQPADTIEFHQRSRAWLQTAVAASDAAHKVVISHHAPSRRSLGPKMAESPVAAAYASGLEPMIESLGLDAWLHGHTHCSADYRVGATRVLANQRGYLPFDPVPGFCEVGVFQL